MELRVEADHDQTVATGLFYKETSVWLLYHITGTGLEAEEDLGSVGWCRSLGPALPLTPWPHPLLAQVLFPMHCCVITHSHHHGPHKTSKPLTSSDGQPPITVSPNISFLLLVASVSYSVSGTEKGTNTDPLAKLLLIHGPKHSSNNYLSQA